MVERIWRCKDDDGTARPTYAPLPHRRNRQRLVAIQKQHSGAARLACCNPEKLTQAAKRGGNRRTRMRFLNIRGGSVLDAKSGSVSGANQHIARCKASTASIL